MYPYVPMYKAREFTQILGCHISLPVTSLIKEYMVRVLAIGEAFHGQYLRPAALQAVYFHQNYVFLRQLSAQVPRCPTWEVRAAWKRRNLEFLQMGTQKENFICY